MKIIKYSGYFLVATGILHNLVGLMMAWPTLAAMHQEAWFASTIYDGKMLFDREAITWFLVAGTFWIIFGLTLQKAISEGFVPPRSLGWSFIIIGIVIAIIMPVSGAYLFIVQGVMLVYGCDKMRTAQ